MCGSFGFGLHTTLADGQDCRCTGPCVSMEITHQQHKLSPKLAENDVVNLCCSDKSGYFDDSVYITLQIRSVLIV